MDLLNLAHPSSGLRSKLSELSPKVLSEWCRHISSSAYTYHDGSPSSSYGSFHHHRESIIYHSPSGVHSNTLGTSHLNHLSPSGSSSPSLPPQPFLLWIGLLALKYRVWSRRTIRKLFPMLNDWCYCGTESYHTPDIDCPNRNHRIENDGLRIPNTNTNGTSMALTPRPHPHQFDEAPPYKKPRIEQQTMALSPYQAMQHGAMYVDHHHSSPPSFDDPSRPVSVGLVGGVGADDDSNHHVSVDHGVGVGVVMDDDPSSTSDFHLPPERQSWLKQMYLPTQPTYQATMTTNKLGSNNGINHPKLLVTTSTVPLDRLPPLPSHILKTLYFPSIYAAQLTSLALQYNDSPSSELHHTFSSIQPIPIEFKKKIHLPIINMTNVNHQANNTNHNTTLGPTAAALAAASNALPPPNPPSFARMPSEVDLQRAASFVGHGTTPAALAALAAANAAALAGVATPAVHPTPSSRSYESPSQGGWHTPSGGGIPIHATATTQHAHGGHNQQHQQHHPQQQHHQANYQPSSHAQSHPPNTTNTNPSTHAAPHHGHTSSHSSNPGGGVSSSHSTFRPYIPSQSQLYHRAQLPPPTQHVLASKFLIAIREEGDATLNEPSTPPQAPSITPPVQASMIRPSPSPTSSMTPSRKRKAHTPNTPSLDRNGVTFSQHAGVTTSSVRLTQVSPLPTHHQHQQQQPQLPNVPTMTTPTTTTPPPIIQTWNDLPPAPFCFFPWNERTMTGQRRSTAKQKKVTINVPPYSDDSSSDSDSSDDDLPHPFSSPLPSPSPSRSHSHSHSSPSSSSRPIDLPSYLCRFIQQQALAPITRFTRAPSTIRQSRRSKQKRFEPNAIEVSDTHNGDGTDPDDLDRGWMTLTTSYPCLDSTEEQVRKRFKQMLSITNMLEQVFNQNNDDDHDDDAGGDDGNEDQRNRMDIDRNSIRTRVELDSIDVIDSLSSSFDESMISPSSPSSSSTPNPQLHLLPFSPRILMSFEDTPGHDELRAYPPDIIGWIDRAGLKPFNPSLNGAFERSLPSSNNGVGVGGGSIGNMSSIGSGSSSATSPQKNLLYLIAPPPGGLLSRFSTGTFHGGDLETWFNNLACIYEQCGFGKCLALNETGFVLPSGMNTIGGGGAHGGGGGGGGNMYNSNSTSSRSSFTPIAWVQGLGGGIIRPPTSHIAHGLMDLRFTRPPWLLQNGSDIMLKGSMGGMRRVLTPITSPIASPVPMPIGSDETNATLNGGVGANLPAGGINLAPSDMPLSHMPITNNNVAVGAGVGGRSVSQSPLVSGGMSPLSTPSSSHSAASGPAGSTGSSTFPPLFSLMPPGSGQARWYQSLLWCILGHLCQVVRAKESLGSTSGSGSLQQPSAASSTSGIGNGGNIGGGGVGGGGVGGSHNSNKIQQCLPFDLDRFDALVVYIVTDDDDDLDEDCNDVVRKRMEHSLPMLSHYLSYLLENGKLLSEVEQFQELYQAHQQHQHQMTMDQQQQQHQYQPPMTPNPPHPMGSPSHPYHRPNDPNMHMAGSSPPPSSHPPHVGVGGVGGMVGHDLEVLFSESLKDCWSNALASLEHMTLTVHFLSSSTCSEMSSANWRQTALNVYQQVQRSSDCVSLFNLDGSTASWVGTSVSDSNVADGASGSVDDNIMELPPFPSFYEPVAILERAPKLTPIMRSSMDRCDAIGGGVDLSGGQQTQIGLEQLMEDALMNNTLQMKTPTPPPPMTTITTTTMTTNKSHNASSSLSSENDAGYAIHMAYSYDARVKALLVTLIDERGVIVHSALLPASLVSSSSSSSSVSFDSAGTLLSSLLHRFLLEHLRPILTILPRTIGVTRVRLIACKVGDRMEDEDRYAWTALAHRWGWTGRWGTNMPRRTNNNATSTPCQFAHLQRETPPIGAATIVDLCLLSMVACPTPEVIRVMYTNTSVGQDSHYSNGIVSSTSNTLLTPSIGNVSEADNNEPSNLSNDITRAKTMFSNTFATKSWWHARLAATAAGGGGGGGSSSSSTGGIDPLDPSSSFNGGLAVIRGLNGVAMNRASCLTGLEDVTNRHPMHVASSHTLAHGIFFASPPPHPTSQRFTSKMMSQLVTSETWIPTSHIELEGYFTPMDSFKDELDLATTCVVCEYTNGPHHERHVPSSSFASSSSFHRSMLTRILLQWSALGRLNSIDVDTIQYRRMHAPIPESVKSRRTTTTGEPVPHLPMHITILTRMHAMMQTL